MSSEEATPWVALYSFLLHSFILSPLQYFKIKPLQANTCEDSYFLKKPHVLSDEHSIVLIITLVFIIYSFLRSAQVPALAAYIKNRAEPVNIITSLFGAFAKP